MSVVNLWYLVVTHSHAPMHIIWYIYDMHGYMIWATRNCRIYIKVPQTPMLDRWTYILIVVWQQFAAFFHLRNGVKVSSIPYLSIYLYVMFYVCSLLACPISLTEDLLTLFCWTLSFNLIFDILPRGWGGRLVGSRCTIGLWRTMGWTFHTMYEVTWV